MVQRGPKPMLSQSLVCFAGKHLEALDGHWALLGGKPPAAGKNPARVWGKVGLNLMSFVW